MNEENEYEESAELPPVLSTELSPENYPKGALVLTDAFYWDCTDDNSPLGNDGGADTHEAYLQWRKAHPETPPITFLGQLMQAWGCLNDHWEVVEPDRLQMLLTEDAFGPFLRDEAVIGLAFAQILVGETLDAEVKRWALLAIQRQSLRMVIEHRGWADPAARLHRLRKMRDVLCDSVDVLQLVLLPEEC
jgi:uncharacterized protein YfeS